jgi:hypothetical protein
MAKVSTGVAKTQNKIRIATPDGGDISVAFSFISVDSD